MSDETRRLWNILNGRNEAAQWPFNFENEHEEVTRKCVPLSKICLNSLVAELHSDAWASGGLGAAVTSIQYLRSVAATQYPSYDVLDLGPLEKNYEDYHA